MINGLYLFSNDLRLQDNALLQQACEECDTLILCFCPEESLFELFPNHYNSNTNDQKRKFIQQSVLDLQHSLHQYNQNLLVINASAHRTLLSLIDEAKINRFYTAHPIGTYEQSRLDHLQSHCPDLMFTTTVNHTLFQLDDLPFQLQDLPSSFTKFRKKVENIKPTHYSQPIQTFPPLPLNVKNYNDALLYNREPMGCEQVTSNRSNERLEEALEFWGGETAGHEHIAEYFSSHYPSCYKQVRNSLDGWQKSTKFSPWLALGCVSPRQILTQLTKYEQIHGANDSTYWIYFELLWREYFQWYGIKYGHRLFCLHGTSNVAPNYCEQDAFSLKQWINGQTQYPIVNACMNQLKQTGFLSNRGRQLVASCLIHELKLDWRLGAYYFQSQLIDHDTASNWGNWQYIAGVGSSPNNERRFDLIKQTKIYDPNHQFIQHWTNSAL